MEKCYYNRVLLTDWFYLKSLMHICAIFLIFGNIVPSLFVSETETTNKQIKTDMLKLGLFVETLLK